MKWKWVLKLIELAKVVVPLLKRDKRRKAPPVEDDAQDN
jgi:hypothetical protein